MRLAIALLALAMAVGGLLMQSAAFAQSQTRSPTAAADCTNQAGIGTVAWGNAGRAISSNNSYATRSVDGTTSNFLRCLNYGFTIPAGATVLGIEVNVERRSNSTANGGSRDAAMRLVKGGTIQATDRSSGTTYTTGDVIETHGGPSDLWGTTWTPADINAANFGAAFAATKPSAAGGAHTISVDHIQITVYFTNNPPPAPNLLSPADGAVVTTATPAFTWSSVVDPDGDVVTYDMQADDSGCGFASPEVSQTGLATPDFTPGAALANATYCWRARAVDPWGAAGPWSTTRNVTVNAPLFQTRSPAGGGDCTNQAGIGTLAWGNTGNAISSNNGYATRTLDGTTSNWLRCLNYGFSIPAGATILGIEVNVERKSNRTTNGGSQDAGMRLVKGGTIQATDRSSGTTYTTGDVIETHGSATDLWGAAWTPTDINAANFGAAFAATKPSAAGNSHTVSVDHIQITVYYAVAVVIVPGSFNAFETATAANATNGVIQTKVAGVAFGLDVVTIVSGAQSPSFNDQVLVDLLGDMTPGGPLDANNCPTGSTVIQTVAPNPTISGGRETVSFAAVPDAWRDVRVRVRWPAASPTVTSCSTDAFAIRPSTLANLSASHADWQNPGTGAGLTNSAFAAGELHKAGRSFTLQAEARNGAGSPAITANYVETPTPTLTACAGAACTASFGNFNAGAAFAAGQLASNAATYDEVGAFNLQLVDSNFASVDAADGTPANCSANGRYVCSATITVGRFVPDHFGIALNTPTFGTICGAGAFTYVGQKFAYTLQPVITIQAQDASNGPITQYTGSWWRITNASLTGKSYTAAAGTLDTSGITGTDPVIADAGSGAGTLTFTSGTGIAFTRTNPVAPFDAEISLAINVIDADGVTATTNPVRFGQAVAGLGMAFNNGKAMRFGRLFATSARGSALVPLSLRLELQYWSGTAFLTHTADTCTTIAANNIEMTNFSQNLDLCETSLTVDAFAKGRATARLSKPGGSNTGSVTLVPRLGTSVVGAQTCIAGSVTAVTGANLPHLQGKWDATDQGTDGKVFDDNPAARGTFGVYPGSGGVIDLRENY